ncbi:MAG: hypothetical protein A4S12_00650 [Proteobacteria bacterium SG_bin5]|nr:MAG: hypothetical protein A4S12_00650 [Proteobacteria bacterium SG_bin5]
MKLTGVDRVAERDASEDVRVLRRLEIREGFTGEGVDEGASVCAVVDVETTGLDMENDAVIQLAIRRFRFDADGLITSIGQSRTWLEDPGKPVPPEVTSMTGISDEDVAGHRFPDDVVIKVLRHVDIIVAHNAGFDRKWIERRFPAAAGLAWACSMSDVDWRSHGFDGRTLGFLGMQCGFFYEAHRADIDVDAVIGLLAHRFHDGRSAMSVLMENAQTDTWIVRAEGAAYGVKERLRARGYRWDPERRVWAKEIRDQDRLSEEFWLAANIYSAEARPRCMGPTIERVPRWERYA